MQVKRIVSAIVLSCFAIVSTVGCSRMMEGQVTSLRTQDIPVSAKNAVLINKIAATIKQKRASGALAKIPASLYSISAVGQSVDSATSDESVGQQLESFYIDPIPVLTGIGQEEKGIEKLELIDAIYSEESADVVAGKMGQLNPNAKDQYVEKLQKVADSSPEMQAQSIAQGIVNKNTGEINLKAIHLRIYGDHSKIANGAAMTWNRVNEHYGNCATALAGELMYILIPDWSGWGWTGILRWVGVALAVSSYKQMWDRLTSWDTFNQVKSVIDGVNNQDNYVAGPKDNNGNKKSLATFTVEDGKMLLALAGSTAIPVAVSYACNGVLSSAVSFFTKYVAPITDRVSYSPANGNWSANYTFSPI